MSSIGLTCPAPCFAPEPDPHLHRCEPSHSPSRRTSCSGSSLGSGFDLDDEHDDDHTTHQSSKYIAVKLDEPELHSPDDADESIACQSVNTIVTSSSVSTLLTRAPAPVRAIRIQPCFGSGSGSGFSSPPSCQRSHVAASEPMWRVYLCLVLAQFMWVGFHLLAKNSFHYIHPFVFPSLRQAIAFPFLAATAVYNDRRSVVSVSRRDIGLFAVCGSLAVTLNQNLFNLGLSLSSAGDAALMQPVMPVFTMCFAVLLKRESPHWLKFAGVGSAVFGSLVIVAAETWLAPYLGSIIGGGAGGEPAATIAPGSSKGSEPTATPESSGSSTSSVLVSPSRAVGLLMFLLQTFFFSIYMMISKPMLERIPAATVTFWTCLFGMIFNFCVSAGFVGHVQWSNVPPIAWIAVVYTGVIAAFVAFSFLTYATKHLPASIASLAVLLQPAAGPICGALILGEKLTVLHLVGGLFILTGLVLVVHQRNREMAQRQTELQMEMEMEMAQQQQAKPHEHQHLTQTPTPSQPPNKLDGAQQQLPLTSPSPRLDTCAVDRDTCSSTCTTHRSCEPEPSYSYSYSCVSASNDELVRGSGSTAGADMDMSASDHGAIDSEMEMLVKQSSADTTQK